MTFDEIKPGMIFHDGGSPRRDDYYFITSNDGKDLGITMIVFNFGKAPRALYYKSGKREGTDSSELGRQQRSPANLFRRIFS